MSYSTSYLKVKIGQNGKPTETWENVKQATREEHGVLIINEQDEELFIPYVNLSFYLVKR